jgi:hypothetical protein
MWTNLTDESKINDRNLNTAYETGWITVISCYNEKTQELKEIWVDDNWGIITSTRWGNLVESDISSSAWWVWKGVLDYSIFHALFIYNIDGTVWKGIEDWVENLDLTTSTRILSTNGALELKTAANIAGNTMTANEPNQDLDLYFSGWDIIALFVSNLKTGTGWEALWLLEFWEER